MYLDDLTFASVRSLLDFAYDRGLGNRTEMQILATTCGLLTRDSDGVIALSKNANIIMQVKPDVRVDLVHYLLYTGWNPETQSINSILWSYRQVTDSLWHRSTADVVSTAKIIAEEINNRTHQDFGNLEGFDSTVSFSAKSIRGVRKWLEALAPPAIEDDVFRRRYFCPPELVLMAVGWVAQLHSDDVGIDFLLIPERRDSICQLCLLDPSALDRVLDWMLPIYPNVIRPGTSAGAYGRFLHFHKWPEMSDLLTSA
jgi:hypothetical protein